MRRARAWMRSESEEPRARADIEHATATRRTAPLLALAGAAVLYRCLSGVVASDSPVWWLQFLAGLVAVFQAGAFWGAAPWERALADRERAEPRR